MVKIWSEWNVARLVLPVSAIVVLFWTAGLWTVSVGVLTRPVIFFKLLHMKPQECPEEGDC